MVEPPQGLSVERLPRDATVGVPIVAGGATYYRAGGVFYREERGPNGVRYVVARSPFEAPLGQANVSPPGAAAAQTDGGARYTPRPSLVW